MSKTRDAFLIGCASRLIKEAALLLRNCGRKTRESYHPLEERDISVDGIRLNLEDFNSALESLYVKKVAELEQ